jgi:segregation and condensation protein B
MSERTERTMIERAEMEAALEAILFVSSEPVPREKLLALFAEGEEREAAAEALAAVLVEDVAGGVRLATRPEVVGWLRRFFDVSAGNKLSMAALETLAIIAYRQPMTGPEVQELRNVSAAGVLKTLLERRLIRIVGRKEVVGKPFLYGTTREFLVHFGLNSLKDLPPLEEFEETFGSGDAGAVAGLAEMAGLTNRDGVEDGGGGGEDREESFLREIAELEELEAES